MQFKYLTVEEVAAAVPGAKVSSVRFWIHTGKIRSCRPGKRRLIREDWLAQFIESGATGGE